MVSSSLRLTGLSITYLAGDVSITKPHVVFSSGCVLNVSWELEKYRGMGPTYRSSEFIILGVYPSIKNLQSSLGVKVKNQIWSKQVNSAHNLSRAVCH